MTKIESRLTEIESRHERTERIREALKKLLSQTKKMPQFNNDLSLFPWPKEADVVHIAVRASDDELADNGNLIDPIVNNLAEYIDYRGKSSTDIKGFMHGRISSGEYVINVRLS